MITWSIVMDPRNVQVVHALSISLSISSATAQSSHNSEIYNIGAHAQYIGTREPGNHDNGASDVWTITAYCGIYGVVTGSIRGVY